MARSVSEKGFRFRPNYITTHLSLYCVVDGENVAKLYKYDLSDTLYTLLFPYYK